MTTSDAPTPPAQLLAGELYELCPHCRSGEQKAKCGLCRQLGLVRVCTRRQYDRMSALAGAVEAIVQTAKDDIAKDAHEYNLLDGWRNQS